MIILLLIIVFVHIVMFFLLKNVVNFFKIISITSIFSGYLFIILAVISKTFFINRNNLIYVSKIIKLLFNKLLDRGLILILVGGVELIIYVLLRMVIYVRKKALL